MNDPGRRTFIKGLGAAVALAPDVTLRPARSAYAADEAASPHLTRIRRDWLITPDEARAWHAAKDALGGPTLAGSPSWRNFLELTERELRASGVVDVIRNPWTYTRWTTTEWPDDSHWSLHVEGHKVRVASYGGNSGSTPEAGLNGGLVLYQPGMPAEALRGKIAIVLKPSAQAALAAAERDPVSQAPAPAGGAVRTGDYEYLSDVETFPDPLIPRLEGSRLSPFGQMGLGEDLEPLTRAGSIGALIVLGLSYDALAGLYTFPVPALHQLPTLYLDIESGARVVEAARAGQRATLRLIATTEEAETYQLFAFLPGRHYGSPEDRRILLLTHTDGPSISQENGALGIAALVRYFSRIPQAQRPRTLMVFLDCRHYMPGMERAFAAQDLAARRPDLYQQVIAAIGIEHLGQMQPEEGPGLPYHLTDTPDLSTVWVTNNDQLIAWAVQAVKDNALRRVQVQCPGRPGLHGGEQGPWYGLGQIARRLGLPGVSTMGSMTAYWTTRARLATFDAPHFVDQVATMCQLCGELMRADVDEIRSV